MKTDIYVTSPCMFMSWNQLRRIVSRRFYRILKRDVHPKTFLDNEYWSVYFDPLTDAEVESLLCSVPIGNHRKIKGNLKCNNREFLPEAIISIVKDDIPFDFNRYIATADGLFFFGENGYIQVRRDKKNEPIG